jgi:HSP20 family protein
MALIPWRGKHKDSGQGELAPLAALRNEMDRLFDSFLREPWGGWDWPFGGQQTWAPAVDVAETDEEVLVRAEIAGMEPKDLNISLTGNQLVLSGEKKESTETKEKGFFHTESRCGTFRRSIPLPGNVDPEKVEAEYSNGVVTIHVKKLQTTPPKRIEVKVR